MVLESRKIKEIYSGKTARKYDFSLPPLFRRWKRLAFDNSTLKNGDRVLVLCCGTGLDFPFILKKIGIKGEIVGVDFSSEMLNQAGEKVHENNWENIKLIEADITRYKNETIDKFDVGVCTLGMSIIPDYRSAYYNLLSHIKKYGEIIIGDMQLAVGWHAYLNPLTIFLSRKFGGTYEGHQNSKELCSIMRKELTEIRHREFFFKSYFYCIGKTQ